jgi:hypothetical protein
MYFHLPRRHRRKLLLPPGLLALAGLLWLGSVVVGSWQEELKQWYVLQLTMPIRTAHHDKNSIRFELPNPDTVCRPCAWKDVYLTNRNDSTDRQEQIRAENAVYAMMHDTEHSNGVRIHFAKAVRFRHLIFALNTLERENVRKYWLDIHHTPTVLYAFYEPPKPTQEPAFECLLCGDVIPYHPPVLEKPFWVRFDDQVTEFWQFKWLQLQQAEWQNSMWLLAVIVTLSGWRIVRAWRTA